MDERYETVLANLAAITAGQQVLLERLMRETPGLAADAEALGMARDIRELLATTRAFIRHGLPKGANPDN